MNENLMVEVWMVVMLSFATAAVALTISKSSVFGWLRRLLPKFELIHCPWCLGFWISAAAIITGGIYDDPFWTVVLWLAVAGVSGVITGVIDRLFLWTERERDHWRNKYEDLAEAITVDQDSA